jgi:hypothetical protein
MVILLVQNELQDMNKDQLKGTAELVQRWYPTEMIGTMHALDLIMLSKCDQDDLSLLVFAGALLGSLNKVGNM